MSHSLIIRRNGSAARYGSFQVQLYTKLHYTALCRIIKLKSDDYV